MSLRKSFPRRAPRILPVLTALFLVASGAAGEILPGDSGTNPAGPSRDFEAVQAEAWELYEAWAATEEEAVPSALRASVDRLWELGRGDSENPSAVKATVEALHLLVHLRDLETLQARIGALPPGDPAWDRVPALLAEVWSLHGEASFVEDVLRAHLGAMDDAETRAAMWLVLGDVQVDDEPAKARQAYQKATEEAPESRAARRAKGNLYEMDNLQLGSPAPKFNVTTLSGEPLRSEDLAGKAVILDVWASW